MAPSNKNNNTPTAAKPLVVTLVNGNEEGCPATLKALWAAQLYGVSLQRGKTKLISTAAIVHNGILIQDGNSMAQAISFCTKRAASTILADTMLDEWCEWERTFDVNKSVPTLVAALETGSPLHLVGNTTTLADICVVVRLNSVNMESLPPSVQTYVSTHSPALETAKASFADLPVEGVVPVDMNNTSLLQVIEGVFEGTLRNLFGQDVEMPKNNWLGRCSVPKQGDYQCTAAMPLFSALKKSGSLPSTVKKPQDIAQMIVDAIGTDHPVIFDLVVNGPGFVLCRVTQSYLQAHVQTFLKIGKLPKPNLPPSLSLQTCVVDFSSPNIAKEMHVGHLRSTIIGESVCRILEFVGYNVHRVNHVGDWGTQFGMLIQYLKEEYPDFANGELPNITDLTQFYKNAKKRFDDSAEFKKIAQLNVVKLQQGDKECRQIWNILCDISRKEFQKVYNRLDITVKECGESFYNSRIPAVIEEFDKAGLVSIEEGGAKCVFVGEPFKIPLMLQKSDGGFGYDSTDMAALKYRLSDLQAQRIIYITDFSQGDHFQMCFRAAEKIGWLKEKQQKLEHIGFGTVMGEDGKRFKTRSGDTVRLVDLLDEAVGRMKESLEARIAEKKANISKEEVPEVAEAIGYSAVKYFDLRRNPTTNYKFSYDQMLDTKGNTAVYLLYAHARLESILAKASAEHKVNVDELTATELQITHGSERNLALHLQMFTDMILATLEDLFPYRVCEYVYSLSIAASDFVTQCKVLGSPEMKSRLLLCKATTMAMRECFDLVGIRHVQRI